MFPFMDTSQIIDWIKNCRSNISLHAYTCTYKKFISHISNTPDIVLTFFVKDHHLHPITDLEFKNVAMCKNQQDKKHFFQYISELKWTRRHDKFTMYNDITNETKNNIIICPGDLDVRKAIIDYVRDTKFYVEYIHYNNNGQLDRFLDHNNNMYVENNEYEIRKQICESLYKTYNIHDFK